MKLTEQQWTYEAAMSLVVRDDPSRPRYQEEVACLFMTAEEAIAYGPGMAAAPDMAKAITETLAQVVASHAPVLGPTVTIEEVAARGHPVMVAPQHMLALIAAAKKAGAL